MKERRKRRGRPSSSKVIFSTPNMGMFSTPAGRRITIPDEIYQGFDLKPGNELIIAVTKDKEPTHSAVAQSGRAQGS